ncbi:TRAP-type C4-dicarboxylate transport system, small permease component [Hoeflea sp. IMCC20628]|uniref:TRAP transporter small permease n=1 Tax=Hoeflea sp. IMCC20628 TaxID=1620421 RepID=UPI00063BE268|nr:TRAP transporter small permease [Hoeflea sp. IMCC20628]AKH98906.1 TRAP-type C4-dicarboxylate transport system, small permease component [Hoeflea sp. IMCC20628]
MKPIFYINRVLMGLSAFWSFFLAVIITVDVVGRGLFNSPLTGSLEIIVNSIVVIAFLQLGYAVGSGSMLRADFILHLLPRRLTLFLDVTGLVIGAIIFGLLCYAVIDPTISAYRSGDYEGEGAMRVPTWPIYATIFFGSLLTTINYILLAFDRYASERPDHV